MSEEEVLVHLIGPGVACVILGLPAVIHAARLMREERAERLRLRGEIAEFLSDRID